MLVGGSVPSEGRVELFYEGEWGRVDVSSTISDITVARVACQQVGYPYCGGTGDFGWGSGTAWVFILSCTGDEERLEQCNHLGWRYSLCFNCTGLGVRCRGECTVCEVYTHWKVWNAGLTSHCCELYLGLLQHLSRPTGADEGPFNVSIEATPFSAFIEWMEPSDNIPLVSGYNITVETLLTKATRTVHTEGNAHEATVIGLTPFTKYSFTVTTKYNCGFGPPSEAVVWRTREHGK